VKSRVTTLVRRRSSFLLSLLVLSGCGSSPERHPAATPSGFTVRADRESGFALALPRSWRSLDRSTALTGSRLRPFGKANPRLRAELRALVGPRSPIKLIAVDPTAKARFRVNMNVIQTRVPKSLTFEQLSKDEAREIKLASAARDMRQATVELPAGRALRLTYRVKQGAVVYQYFVQHADLLYVLTYTVSGRAAPRYAKIFDMSARTFELR
jgi:hypothetical protein